MHINTVGSQGVGKTAFCTALHDRIGGKFIPSTARRALEYGYKLNDEADPLSQLITTVSRITAETDAGNHGTVISDRTPVDSLAYTKYQMDHVWTPDEGNDFYWEVSKDIVRQHMGKADIIIYVPITFTIVDDGVRSLSLDYQEEIDSNIQSLLKELSVDFMTMPPGSVEKRVEWLMNYFHRIDKYSFQGYTTDNERVTNANIHLPLPKL